MGPNMNTPSILVIKLGALGDFVQALVPMAAIRNHHPHHRIVLLTTRPYLNIAEKSSYFDHIWIDEKPKFFQIRTWWRLRNRLLAEKFDRVYDLQTSDRSGFYFKLLGPGTRPEWSGVATGCSHPHSNPDRDFMHTLDRQREQLQGLGIDDVPAPDLSWLDEDISVFNLSQPFMVLAAGGAGHRPDKRWDIDNYTALAKHFLNQGITPVLIGSLDEQDELVTITNACPGARNLCGQTDLMQIAGLARRAQIAVGNDTGPMHLIAAVGGRCMVLFSNASDPKLCGQRGVAVDVVHVSDLNQLSVDDVIGRLSDFMPPIPSNGS